MVGYNFSVGPYRPFPGLESKKKTCPGLPGGAGTKQVSVLFWGGAGQGQLPFFCRAARISASRVEADTGFSR